MNRVKEARTKKRMSQIALFAATGIHPAIISYIERQYLPAKEGQKEKLAAALGVRKGWLFPKVRVNNHPGRSILSPDLASVQLSASAKK